MRNTYSMARSKRSWRRGGATRAATDNVVSATEAAKNFGALVDRVRDERHSYVIERGGIPVAQIGPVSTRRFTVRDFVELLESTPHPGEEYLEAVERGIAEMNREEVPENRWEP